MTVPVERPFYSFTYVGPGDFPIGFTIVDAGDIDVSHYVPDSSVVRLIYGQDYTLTWTPYERPTLHLLYDKAPYEGEIQVRRVIPVNQETDWVNQGPFDQELIEKNLDKLTMLIQDTLFFAGHDANRNWRGKWKPNTAYNLHDIVTGPDDTQYELSTFSALVTHESSDDFEQDFNAGLWQITMDMTYLYELAAQVEQDADRAETARYEAEEFADNAANSAQEASGHADNAEQYATQAGDYVGQAAEHATKAYKWAENPVDVPVENNEYSAYHWAQKAAEYAGIHELSTSDPDMLFVTADTNDRKHKIININSDVPSGIPKLNYEGRIKADQLPVTMMHLLGPLRGDDTCPKPGDSPGDCVDPDYRNPSERWPGTEWPEGAYFIISSDGNMNLMDSGGNYVVTPVSVGDAVMYVKDGVVLPEGWYFIPSGVSDIILASMVLFDDSSTVIKGTNVQSWNQSADAAISNRVQKSGDTMTGGLGIQHTEPELSFIEDGQPVESSGQTWRILLDDLILRLQANDGDTGNWIEALRAYADGVVQFPIALPEGPDAEPDKDVQLVNKKYVDATFLNALTGGTVDGPINVANRLTVSSAYLTGNNIMILGFGLTDVLTYDPDKQVAVMPVPLHLPANVDATDPQPPL